MVRRQGGELAEADCCPVWPPGLCACPSARNTMVHAGLANGSEAGKPVGRMPPISIVPPSPGMRTQVSAKRHGSGDVGRPCSDHDHQTTWRLRW